jgi:hypothetical protein
MEDEVKPGPWPFDDPVNGSRALLDVLPRQGKIHFPDVITGDKSYIAIDTTPSSIGLSLDEELPTRPPPTIGADKRMLVAFWDQTRVHLSWLSTDARINAAYFRDDVLAHIS